MTTPPPAPPSSETPTLVRWPAQPGGSTVDLYYTGGSWPWSDQRRQAQIFSSKLEAQRLLYTRAYDTYLQFRFEPFNDTPPTDVPAPEPGPAPEQRPPPPPPLRGEVWELPQGYKLRTYRGAGYAVALDDPAGRKVANFTLRRDALAFRDAFLLLHHQR